MLLQHLGAIRRFVLDLVPAVSWRLPKPSEPTPATARRELASIDPLERAPEAEPVDARIAKIINDIPQRRIRRQQA